MSELETSRRSLFRTFIRYCWYTVVAALIAVALLLSAARLLLPMAGDYHDELARWVSDLLGHPVRITGLGASWHGFGPSIELKGVTVLDSSGTQAVLQCDTARIDIDLWSSLRHWQLELGQLTVRGAHLSAVRMEDGSIAVIGLSEFADPRPDPAAQEALKRWLARQHVLAMEDSTLHWRDLGQPGDALSFTGVRLQLRNRGLRHRLEADVALPAQLGTRLSLIADVRGDVFLPSAWEGAFYLRGEGLRLAAWGGYAGPGIGVRDAQTDFTLWGQWRDGLQRLGGNLSAENARLEFASVDAAAADTTTPVLALARVQGRFQWRQEAEGWSMDVDDFSLRGEGEDWPGGQVRVQFRPGSAAARPRIEAAYSYIDVAEALAFARQAGVVPASQQARLAALAPQGSLREGYLRYQWGGEAPPALLLRSEFDQLAFKPEAAVPGVSGLRGRVVTDGDRAVVEFDGASGEFNAAMLFRAPLSLTELRGRLAWRQVGGSWQLMSPGLRLANDDIHGQVAFRLVRSAGVGAPYLDLHAAFADGKAAHTGAYLPARIMPPGVVDWLDKALVAGRVTQGTARLQGWLNEFPYDHGAGEFEVGFHVSRGVLRYAPGWPRLEGIETDVRFRGRRFEARATAARSLRAEVQRVDVAIADLNAHPAILSLDAEAHGATAAALRHVMESPVRDKVGHYLTGMSASGRSRLQIAVLLPLAADQAARVDGVLSFEGSGLSLAEVDLDFTDIRGDLVFNESGLRARDLHLRILDQEALLQLRSEGQGEAAYIVFEAQGIADAGHIAKTFAPMLAPRLSGITPWRGELRLAPPARGGAQLRIDSTLQGATLRLPAPFAKTALEERPLSLALSLPMSKGENRLRYAELAEARWRMAPRTGGGMRLERGELRLGGAKAELPKDERLRIRGTLSQFAPVEWAALGRSSGTGTRLSAAEDIKVELDIKTAELLALGQRFPRAELHAVRRGDAWEAVLDSPQAAGKLRMPDGRDAPMVADMARLHFVMPTALSGTPAAEGPKPDAIDPREVPPLRLHAASFRYGELDLGEVTLRSARSAHGIIVEEFKGRSPLHRTDLYGRWEQSGGVQRSAFNIAFESDDVGETLVAAGYADVLKAGKMHTGMDLIWPGGPSDFALARAQGTLSLKIKDGRMLDVSPGAGRILGLLSFQALPRRLTLDFSDLFQKGFAFDRIEGNFVVENGQALTDNLTMDGPAAHILARGRVGLVTEEYDQRVTVTPNMSGGLPLAAAIAGGVMTGAAMLLVERLFKPQIDGIGRVEYHVTGPWSAPLVQRAGSSAAALSEKTQGEAAASPRSQE